MFLITDFSLYCDQILILTNLSSWLPFSFKFTVYHLFHMVNDKISTESSDQQRIFQNQGRIFEELVPI